MENNDLPYNRDMNKAIPNVVDVFYNVLQTAEKEYDWHDTRTHLIWFLTHKVLLEKNSRLRREIRSFEDFFHYMASSQEDLSYADVSSLKNPKKNLMKLYWEQFKDYSLLETNRDELESVLLSFAISKKEGVYQIPRTISDFIVKLTLRDEMSNKIYIPFITSTTFLFSILDIFMENSDRHNFENIHVEQRNQEIFLIIKLILLLRGVSVTLRLSDVREIPYFESYDHIYANPTFGIRDNDEFSFLDKLLRQNELPNKISIIVSPQFLWKNDKESRRIRNDLLENYHVRAVIQFPEGIFYKVMIAPTLVILEKRREKQNLFQIKNEEIFASIIDDSHFQYDVIDEKFLNTLSNTYQEFLENNKITQNQESFVFDSKDLVDNTWIISNKYYSKEDVSMSNGQILGNLVEIKRGIILKSQELSGNIPSHFKEYIRISDIDDYGKIHKTKRFVEINSEKKSIKNAITKKDDILLSNRATIGKTAIVTEKDVGKIVSSQIFILKIKDDTQVLPKYLQKILASKKIHDELIRRGRGSIYLGISLSDVEQLVVSIPPLEEQRQILLKHEDEFECIIDEINHLEKRLTELKNKLKTYEL